MDSDSVFLGSGFRGSNFFGFSSVWIFHVSKDRIVCAFQQCKSAANFEKRVTCSVKSRKPSIFWMNLRVGEPSGKPHTDSSISDSSCLAHTHISLGDNIL